MRKQACALLLLFPLGSLSSAAWGERACNSDEGLQARLTRHEGLRPCVYFDQFDNPTIGVGHLLKRPVPVGLCWSDSKIQAVLDHDIARAKSNARHDLNDDEAWESLSQDRQAVLVEMSFQLGGNGLLHFQKMLAHVRKSEFGAAADEMLNSRWARQTPKRAQELACLMRGSHD